MNNKSSHFNIGIFKSNSILTKKNSTFLAQKAIKVIPLHSNPKKLVAQLKSTTLNALFVDVRIDTIAKFELLQQVFVYHPNTILLAYSNQKNQAIVQTLLSILSYQKAEQSIILTTTEKQIVPLLIKGLSSKEIADKLFISVNTVNFHKKNLFKKFKVKNIASFVKEVILRGYIVENYD